MPIFARTKHKPLSSSIAVLSVGDVEPVAVGSQNDPAVAPLKDCEGISAISSA